MKRSAFEIVKEYIRVESAGHGLITLGDEHKSHTYAQGVIKKIELHTDSEGYSVVMVWTKDSITFFSFNSFYIETKESDYIYR